MKSLEDTFLINKGATILDAIKKINQLSSSRILVLFVVSNDRRVLGSLTDGDIRRALINGLSLNSAVTHAMKTDFHFIKHLDDYNEIKRMKELDVKILPHITEDKKLIDLIKLKNLKSILPLDAVIMAGGKGVRLRPYTNNTPKPMLELENKPILAHNIDRLLKYGIKNIYISVNHLKEQIIDYIDKNYKDYDIRFIEETDPLGTIGAVSLVNNFVHNDILVMNADILTNIDFEDFYANYKNFNDDMTVATCNIRINIPYGIFDTTDKTINSLVEKPSFIYYSNAGIYLLKKETLKYVPKNKPYDATELMEDLIKEHKKVSHFPIRGYWLDIGNAQNYAKAQDDIRFIKF